MVLSKPATVQHSSSFSVSQLQLRTSGRLQKLCVQRDISKTTSLTHMNKNEKGNKREEKKKLAHLIIFRLCLRTKQHNAAFQPDIRYLFNKALFQTILFTLKNTIGNRALITNMSVSFLEFLLFVPFLFLCTDKLISQTNEKQMSKQIM